jgi:hypothetical protein
MRVTTDREGSRECSIEETVVPPMNAVRVKVKSDGERVVSTIKKEEN